MLAKNDLIEKTIPVTTKNIGISDPAMLNHELYSKVIQILSLTANITKPRKPSTNRRVASIHHAHPRHIRPALLKQIATSILNLTHVNWPILRPSLPPNLPKEVNH
jgi:hypothetical protein